MEKSTIVENHGDEVEMYDDGEIVRLENLPSPPPNRLFDEEMMKIFHLNEDE